MRKITCDRCGAEIPSEQENVGYVSVNMRDVETDDMLENNPFEHWDFCDDCLNAIHAFITDPKAKKEKFEKILDSVDAGKKPKPQKPKKPVKDWDKGKAQALRDAGWTIIAIAKELGVSEPTICKHTHPAQPRKERPNEWAEKEPDLSAATRSMMGEKHIEEVEDETHD